jgi:hypothetical protein
MSDKEIEGLLRKVSVTRREAVRKLIIGAAFTVPVVMSFTMTGIPINQALAQCSNATGCSFIS